MHKRRFLSSLAVALAGGLLAAGCATTAVMPLAGGGRFFSVFQPAAMVQPQMDTALPQVTHMLGHSTAAQTVPYIYFPPNLLCEH